MNFEISERYITAIIKGATRAELLSLRSEVGAEIREIKAGKSDVFARFPGIHGRFQQSQLDVFDIRERKCSVMFDNLSEMIASC